MKVLKAIPLDKIPAHGSGRRTGTSPNEALFQEVLRLNGSALPVEHESLAAAMHLAHACRAPAGRARTLGIVAAQRGKTVFLYCEKK